MIPMIIVSPLIFGFILSFIPIITDNEYVTEILLLLGTYLPWAFFLTISKPVQEVLGGWSRFTGIEVGLGGFDFYFILAELILFSLVSVYSLGYFEHNRLNKVYSLFLLMHAGLLGAFISRDLFNYYIYLEIASAAVFGLVGISNVKGAKKAAFRYITFYFVASYFLIMSIAIIYMETGYLNLHLIKENLVMSLGLRFAIGLAFVSLILKAGIFPLYFWLPDAHSKAQTPVSALLSGMMVKGSVFGMILLGNHLPIGFLGEPLKIVAFSSMAFGVILALLQTNIKRLLAYHTVSQLGYVLLGISTLNFRGAIFHVFAHALFKSGLFLGAGSLIDDQNTKNLNKLSYNRNWVLIISMMFLSLSIGGISPFIGGFSKNLLLSGIDGIWKYLFYSVSIGTLVSFTKMNYYLLSNDGSSSPRPLSVIVTFSSGVLTLGLGLYFFPTLKLIDLGMLAIGILGFFALKQIGLFKLDIKNPVKEKVNGIGAENNFYAVVFVSFLILILLQGF